MAFFALALVAAVMGLLKWYGAGIPRQALAFVCWAGLAALAAYSVLKRSLTVWILFAMLVGAAVGYYYPHLALNSRVLFQVFLRLIRTIIAPLLFGTLVTGIAGHADLKKVGRMGIKAIVYFEVVTTIALVIGLAAINISKAGVGIHLPPATSAASELSTVPKHTASDFILNVFPENIAQAIGQNQILQVVVFSILFAIGLAMVREDKRRPMLAFCESLTEAMFKFTNIVMWFAPFGVGAAIAYTVAGTGFGVLVNLAKLLATLYVALAIFLCGVLLPILLMTRVPVKRFLRAVAEPATISFATSSSEAALPRAMEAMESIGVPRQIVAFVMPTGYSFNMDGGTLYLALASMFVAQAGGLHLGVGQQVFMMVTLMLSSKGIAGVSRGSMVVLMGTAAQLGLPSEPIFILLGIDQLMDMARTTVNVLGNCLATVVVAKWEGDFATEKPSAAAAEGAAQ
jgi:proton glutamate symport protein